MLHGPRECCAPPTKGVLCSTGQGSAVLHGPRECCAPRTKGVLCSTHQGSAVLHGPRECCAPPTKGVLCSTDQGSAVLHPLRECCAPRTKGVLCSTHQGSAVLHGPRECCAPRTKGVLCSTGQGSAVLHAPRERCSIESCVTQTWFGACVLHYTSALRGRPEHLVEMSARFQTLLDQAGIWRTSPLFSCLHQLRSPYFSHYIHGTGGGTLVTGSCVLNRQLDQEWGVLCFEGKLSATLQVVCR